MSATRQLKLTANSSRAITFGPPAGLAASYSLTLPPDDGVAGQPMITDGSGVLTFSHSVVLNPSGTAIGLHVDNDGTGSAAKIDQDGNGIGLEIVNDGTSRALDITQNGAGTAVLLTQTQNQIGLFVLKTGAGANAAAQVENDGTGNALFLNQDGNAAALGIDMADGTTNPAIDLTHNETDDGTKDIDGTGSNWYATRNGALVVKRIVMASAAKTIAAGVITLSATDGSDIAVTGEGDAADQLDTISVSSANEWPDGSIIILRAANAATDITVADGTDLRLAGNMVLDSDEDTLTLKRSGAVWVEIARSSNA